VPVGSVGQPVGSQNLPLTQDGAGDVIVAGSQLQPLQQNATTYELLVEDTGVNTNPEQWLQDNHWEPDAEITIAAAGAGGEQEAGDAVATGTVRRIREITIRHEGSDNTVVTLLDASGGNIKVSIDVPAQTTRVWSSQDGRSIAAGLTPVIQTSDITGGSTYVSGVEK